MLSLSERDYFAPTIFYKCLILRLLLFQSLSCFLAILSYVHSWRCYVCSIWMGHHLRKWSIIRHTQVKCSYNEIFKAGRVQACLLVITFAWSFLIALRELKRMSAFCCLWPLFRLSPDSRLSFDIAHRCVFKKFSLVINW